MSILIIGLILFIGIHMLPSLPKVRAGLLERLGEKTYKGIFAAIAFVGLILIIIGKNNAEFIVIWDPPVWGRDLTYLLMAFAFILLTAAYLPTNIKRFTRHPMLWGIVLWSVSHLLANGDLASMLIFAVIGIYALFDMVSANARGAELLMEKLSVNKDITVIMIGIVSYILVLLTHPAWSGLRMLK